MSKLELGGALTTAVAMAHIVLSLSVGWIRTFKSLHPEHYTCRGEFQVGCPAWYSTIDQIIWLIR